MKHALTLVLAGLIALPAAGQTAAPTAAAAGAETPGTKPDPETAPETEAETAPELEANANPEAEAELPEPTIILEGYDVDLGDFLWLKRPVLVFADSAADPRYVQQMQFITDRLSDLEERDVIVLTDTDPAAMSAIRTKLRPRGFMLALIGKDGGVKLRKPLPWDVREISRSIDKMPMRQQEIKDRRVAP